MVEIGRVWVQATDTVTMTNAPGATDATGAIVGEASAITSLTLTTATEQVTTFVMGGNTLDVDPDQSKQSADFFYISESPSAGMGGAYAELQLKKRWVRCGAEGWEQPNFSQCAWVHPRRGHRPDPMPTAPKLIGTPQDDTLTGKNAPNQIDGRDVNDTILSRGGSDTVDGGNGKTASTRRWRRPHLGRRGE